MIATLVPDIDDRMARQLPRHSPGPRLLQGYIVALSTDSVLPGPDVASVAVPHVHDLLCHIIGASRDGEEIIVARGQDLAAGLGQV